MLKSVLQQLDSQPTSGARRAIAIIVVVAAVAFLAFTIWIALQYRSSNSWSEIREVVDPIVAWTVRKPEEWDAVRKDCDNLIFEGYVP